MLVMEVAMRDCKNHAILLDDWKVDDLPRKVYETCGRHCKAGTAHAFRQLSGCETFIESHEGGYNNIP
jgi:hypothetical protein